MVKEVAEQQRHRGLLFRPARRQAAGSCAWAPSGRRARRSGSPRVDFSRPLPMTGATGHPRRSRPRIWAFHWPVLPLRLAPFPAPGASHTTQDALLIDLTALRRPFCAGYGGLLLRQPPSFTAGPVEAPEAPWASTRPDQAWRVGRTPGRFSRPVKSSVLCPVGLGGSGRRFGGKPRRGCPRLGPGDLSGAAAGWEGRMAHWGPWSTSARLCARPARLTRFALGCTRSGHG